VQDSSAHEDKLPQAKIVTSRFASGKSTIVRIDVLLFVNAPPMSQYRNQFIRVLLLQKCIEKELLFWCGFQKQRKKNAICLGRSFASIHD